MIAEQDLPDWFNTLHTNGCACGGGLAGLEKCRALALEPRRDFILAALRARVKGAA